MANNQETKNPLYSIGQFQRYLGKESLAWPRQLQDAFFDALLLIQPMGRKRIASSTNPSITYGRNMLIAKYILLRGIKIDIPYNKEWILDSNAGEDGRERRSPLTQNGRKRVSSHIQVLKPYLATLVTGHFILPVNQAIPTDQDTNDLKSNKILTAIADGILPNELPNYDYFSMLLGADEDVFLRPKQCLIFVSPPWINAKKEHGNNNPAIVLHDYTRALSQKPSSSIEEISRKWAVSFPELSNRLMGALNDIRLADERTSRYVVGPCDTFHFEIALDMHSGSIFPNGSELRGVIDLAICQPSLHHHSWKSVTSIAKPKELQSSGLEMGFWNHNELVESFAPGDAAGYGNEPYGFTVGGQHHMIRVPFPATNWAETFGKLAPCSTEEREKEHGLPVHKSQGASPGTYPPMPLVDKAPSVMELLSKVAMYQEVWSARNNGDEIAEGTWTRRAVILWSFVPTHEHRSGKGKAKTVVPGTKWQFLTRLDPSSQYHQRHAYLSRSSTMSADSSALPDQYMPRFHESQYTMTTTCAATQKQEGQPILDKFANLDTPAPRAYANDNSHTASFDNVDFTTVTGSNELLYGLPSLTPYNTRDHVGMHGMASGGSSLTTTFPDWYIPNISPDMPWTNVSSPTWNLDAPWCAGYANNEASLSMADSAGMADHRARLPPLYIQAPSQGYKRTYEEEDGDTEVRHSMDRSNKNPRLGQPLL
ncbi:Uu.00g095480.m01.CDS01 [Anthostomella pinea]|uniref:Uu.00g095480.m01.CDS01 n=1 Tax=Anthostomella pinea TaxID=933095 RepID=A0AAI8YCG0_9PEZI|nr:Uu.00g095480.m01.CDS01 [Anthostomella pinea]